MKTTQSEDVLFGTLLQLLVVILAARMGNIAARRSGQPGAVGEIVVGLLLGPSFLGHAAPAVSQMVFNPGSRGTLSAISQIGLIFLMFQIGSEFEFGRLKEGERSRAVLTVAAASIVAPLGLGVLLGLASAPTLAPSFNALSYSLFLGLAPAITAVPILGRILDDFQLTCSELGAFAISAAAINDVVGWLLLSVISAATAARLSMTHVAEQIGGLILIAAAMWFIGRRLVSWSLSHLPIKGGVLAPTLIALCIGLQFGFAVLTYLAGIFTIFGGFAAGLLFQNDRPFVSAWRKQVGEFVLVFFVPVFFTLTGLRTNILGLSSLSDWLWCFGILVVAVAAKIVPVSLTAWVSKVEKTEAIIVGVLMNTRALMELIVLNIAYDLGVLPQKVFTMLVIMAIATTLMTGPLLQRLLPHTRYGLGRT